MIKMERSKDIMDIGGKKVVFLDVLSNNHSFFPREFVDKFSESGHQLTPRAISCLLMQEADIEELIAKIDTQIPQQFVITEEDIERILRT